MSLLINVVLFLVCHLDDEQLLKVPALTQFGNTGAYLHQCITLSAPHSNTMCTLLTYTRLHAYYETCRISDGDKHSLTQPSPSAKGDILARLLLTSAHIGQVPSSRRLV